MLRIIPMGKAKKVTPHPYHKETMQKIAVLAGNPRLTFLNGELNLDPQIHAFSKALEHAATMRSSISKIAIAFDHVGLFRKQQAFFDPKLELSTAKKERVRLAYLHPHIRQKYEEIAQYFGFPLIDIRVISEDTCRSSAFQLIDPANLQFFRSINEFDLCINNDEASPPVLKPTKRKFKATCKGITAFIIAKLADCNETQIETYWQFDPMRCDPFSTITPGTKLALEHLGVKAVVNQNIVFVNSLGVTKIERECFDPVASIPAPLTKTLSESSITYGEPLGSMVAE